MRVQTCGWRSLQRKTVGKMAMLLGRRVVGMDSMAAVKIENVIMAEVLRWWKQRKELILKPLTILVFGLP